ncbi:MAG: hypothetical protein QM767_03525 [Anaeromyxobacter sp.]
MNQSCLAALALLLSACHSGSTAPSPSVVTTLEDVDPPPAGQQTLRGALAATPAGGTVTFAPGLDGGTIALRLVGERHALLQGEVFTFAAGRWTFQGFQDRDYGASALHVDRDVRIDASALPHGLTLAWAGDEPARVLSVRGDLELIGVTVRDGRAEAVARDDTAQPYTLARGGGLAVWGTATLRRCAVVGNRADGDRSPSRDRGAFGGGIYADSLWLEDSTVGGNAVSGFGAAGGGLYSVGGARAGAPGSQLHRSAVTGNRVTGQHAYGGGVYTDGGGPGHAQRLLVSACTVARNAVEDLAEVAEDVRFQFYYRGGGVYMSNGALSLSHCTIAENAVTGAPATFNGAPNMGGGGVAATIGDAHTVEDMALRADVIAGNTVAGEADDLFTGSLVNLYSAGRNRVGVLDASHLLAPIPWWTSLARRHFPVNGDAEGVAAADALDLAGAQPTAFTSAGVDAGQPSVAWYPPGPASAGTVPPGSEAVTVRQLGYQVVGGVDDFLALLLARLREPGQLGPDFAPDLADPTGVTFHGPSQSWPSNAENAPWLAFWSDLDAALVAATGRPGLGDDFWAGFEDGPLGDNVVMESIEFQIGPVHPPAKDQRGQPLGAAASAGAVY